MEIKPEFIFYKALLHLGIFEQFINNYNDFNKTNIETPKDFVEHFRKRGSEYLIKRLCDDGIFDLWLSFNWIHTKEGSTYWHWRSLQIKSYVNHVFVETIIQTKSFSNDAPHYFIEQLKRLNVLEKFLEEINQHNKEDFNEDKLTSFLRTNLPNKILITSLTLIGLFFVFNRLSIYQADHYGLSFWKTISNQIKEQTFYDILHYD